MLNIYTILWSYKVSRLVDVGLDGVLPVSVAPHVALGGVRVDEVRHLVPVRPRLLAPPPSPPLPRIASLRPFFVPASHDRIRDSESDFDRRYRSLVGSRDGIIPTLDPNPASRNPAKTGIITSVVGGATEIQKRNRSKMSTNSTPSGRDQDSGTKK